MHGGHRTTTPYSDYLAPYVYPDNDRGAATVGGAQLLPHIRHMSLSSLNEILPGKREAAHSGMGPGRWDLGDTVSMRALLNARDPAALTLAAGQVMRWGEDGVGTGSVGGW